MCGVCPVFSETRSADCSGSLNASAVDRAHGQEQFDGLSHLAWVQPFSLTTDIICGYWIGSELEPVCVSLCHISVFKHNMYRISQEQPLSTEGTIEMDV